MPTIWEILIFVPPLPFMGEGINDSPNHTDGSWHNPARKPGRRVSRTVLFPPLDKASSVCSIAHYLSQTDTGFVRVQRLGNRWRQQIRGEVLWVWPPSRSWAWVWREGTPMATFFCASLKQRRAGRENTSSFKGEHFCLTSLGRKSEDRGPELKAWRGAPEVWGYNSGWPI